jgi:hypothetical protein
MSYAPQGVGQSCAITLSGTGITQVGPNEYALKLSVSGNHGNQSCEITANVVDIDGATVTGLQGSVLFETFGNLIENNSGSTPSWYNPSVDTYYGGNPAFNPDGIITSVPSGFTATVTAIGVGQVVLNASFPLGGTFGTDDFGGPAAQGKNGDIGVYAKLTIQVVA